jgi:hypothetical protein
MVFLKITRRHQLNYKQKMSAPHRQNRVTDEATLIKRRPPPAWDGRPLVADLRDTCILLPFTGKIKPKIIDIRVCSQNIGVYFSKAGIYQNIEEFLTTNTPLPLPAGRVRGNNMGGRLGKTLFILFKTSISLFISLIKLINEALKKSNPSWIIGICKFNSLIVSFASSALI